MTSLSILTHSWNLEEAQSEANLLLVEDKVARCLMMNRRYVMSLQVLMFADNVRDDGAWECWVKL